MILSRYAWRRRKHCRRKHLKNIDSEVPLLERKMRKYTMRQIIFLLSSWNYSLLASCKREKERYVISFTFMALFLIYRAPHRTRQREELYDGCEERFAHWTMWHKCLPTDKRLRPLCSTLNCGPRFTSKDKSNRKLRIRQLLCVQ